MDRSQSMRLKSAALLTAVSAVLHSIRKDDELFAVDFNDRVSFELPEEHPFTNDPKAIEAALMGARSEGRTALYDGVAEGLRQLRSGHGARRALVVISDGGDNASRRKYADAAADLREQYALGFEPGDRADARAFRKIAVTVTAGGQGRLRVRTRSGYLVAPERANP